MTALALVVTLALAAAAEEEVDAGVPDESSQPAEPPSPAAPAEQGPVEPTPELWAGEQRRVHAGVGLRVHGGLMSSGGAALWVLQSELIGILSIRLRGHDELRVQLGYGAGYPDSLGGETNVSFHHAFSPRVSLGIGGFVYLSIWSLRLGVEAPLIIRIGSSRRHQLLLALRVHSGVFNNVPLLAWRLSTQRFAIAGDVAVGYAFQF